MDIPTQLIAFQMFSGPNPALADPERMANTQLNYLLAPSGRDVSSDNLDEEVIGSEFGKQGGF